MHTPSPDNFISPLGLTCDQFAARWKQSGLPGGIVAARAAYSRFYREGDLSALPESATAEIAPIVKRHTEPCDEGVTVKFCQRLDRARRLDHDDSDSLESARLKTLGTARRAADTLPLGILQADDRVEHLDIETVIIPMIGRTGRKAHTMCISSQIGCAMACDFCETGQMGLIRSLTAAEMVGQWWAARHVLSRIEKDSMRYGGEVDDGQDARPTRVREKIDINNIVFMGMGEPLDNLDAVLETIACLTDDRGPGMAMSNITISTVGRIDGLRRLVDVVQQPGWKRLGLALSVNAPNDEIRNQIMPVNKRWGMAELREVMEELVRVRNSRKILFEYVLIPGVNDSKDNALELADWLRPFTRNEHHGHIGLLNVIPYNPRRDSPWPSPDEARVTDFVNWLTDAGVYAKRRRTKGRDQMAACGQLGSAEIRKRKYTPT